MSGVRSISQAFAILRLIGEGGPLSLSDVARARGMSPSSCLAILRTLVAEGALLRDGPSKRYRLTAEWSGAGPFSGDRQKTIIDRLRPAMVEISRMFETTVGLWKVAEKRRLCLVAHVESDAPMRIQMAPGQRQPIGSGAVGRVISASQEVGDSELARRFGEVRWERPTSLAGYITDVEQARIRRFAIDDGALHSGICSIAVALAGPYAGFSISISTFAGSRSGPEIEAVGEQLAMRCEALVAETGG
jgi:DNA-binding IclR family transcriptional regulator